MNPVGSCKHTQIEYITETWNCSLEFSSEYSHIILKLMIYLGF